MINYAQRLRDKILTIAPDDILKESTIFHGGSFTDNNVIFQPDAKRTCFYLVCKNITDNFIPRPNPVFISYGPTFTDEIYMSYYRAYQHLKNAKSRDDIIAFMNSQIAIKKALE